MDRSGRWQWEGWKKGRSGKDLLGQIRGIHRSNYRWRVNWWRKLDRQHRWRQCSSVKASNEQISFRRELTHKKRTGDRQETSLFPAVCDESIETFDRFTSSLHRVLIRSVLDARSVHCGQTQVAGCCANVPLDFSRSVRKLLQLCLEG